MASARQHTDDRPLNVAAAAEWLGVGERMVRRLVAEKRIRYVKVGALVRFRPGDLDEFLAKGTVEPVERPAATPPPAGKRARDVLSQLGTH